MKLTRQDLLKKSINKPLHKLGWGDIKGSMRSFAEADIVMVSDGGKTRIMKDRQGQFLNLQKDINGLIDSALIKNI